MAKIDLQEARERICRAFCEGMARRYGERTYKEVELEMERPGPLYFDRNEEWTDPEGKKRKGRMKRHPSSKVVEKVQVPQGVEADEMAKMAEGMVDAFLEVLKIAQEGGVKVEGSVIEAGDKPRD